ncbi:universal stress protein A-like protein [Cucumis melo var. makuwa]|uniref:Universal stress protein A-like protein n=1 Tax=Cucumis melo var. makuwa TaxID=1194695 RepID=A0A5D3D3W1_CUCMM|nr:universal stress protein A-like protein [Cucumis melo var. makuwa]
MATGEKQVMVVGIDDSAHSLYALEWTLDHLLVPISPVNSPFKLIVVHAKPSASSAISLAGPGAAEVLPYVDSDLKKIAARVIEKAKEICLARSVHDVVLEVIEGDARNVLCEAVEKHHASVLVVGSHGYGAIKRAVLGSVSDYCAHHAHCTVMIKSSNSSVLLLSGVGIFLEATFADKLVDVHVKPSLGFLVSIFGSTIQEGDARYVLFEVVTKHRALVLVVRNDGRGAIKRKVVSIWKSKRVECEFVCGQGGGQGELYSNNFLGGGTTELTLFSPMFRMDKYFVYHFLV